MSSTTEFKNKPTQELKEIVDMIAQILEERDEVVPDVDVGDKVSFALRKDCVITGTITSKTEKRAKITCDGIEGIYQIALKKIEKVA
jgi:flavodoxin